MKSLRLKTEAWGTLKLGDCREDKEPRKVREKEQSGEKQNYGILETKLRIRDKEERVVTSVKCYSQVKYDGSKN